MEISRPPPQNPELNIETLKKALERDIEPDSLTRQLVFIRNCFVSDEKTSAFFDKLRDEARQEVIHEIARWGQSGSDEALQLLTAFVQKPEVDKEIKAQAEKTIALIKNSKDGADTSDVNAASGLSAYANPLLGAKKSIEGINTKAERETNPAKLQEMFLELCQLGKELKDLSKDAVSSAVSIGAKLQKIDPLAKQHDFSRLTAALLESLPIENKDQSGQFLLDVIKQEDKHGRIKLEYDKTFFVYSLGVLSSKEDVEILSVLSRALFGCLRDGIPDAPGSRPSPELAFLASNAIKATVLKVVADNAIAENQSNLTGLFMSNIYLQTMSEVLCPNDSEIKDAFAQNGFLLAKELRKAGLA